MSQNGPFRPSAEANDPASTILTSPLGIATRLLSFHEQGLSVIDKHEVDGLVIRVISFPTQSHGGTDELIDAISGTLSDTDVYFMAMTASPTPTSRAHTMLGVMELAKSYGKVVKIVILGSFEADLPVMPEVVWLDTNQDPGVLRLKLASQFERTMHGLKDQ